MGDQQFWIRVRIRNGGQIIDMHAPVAYAMIAGGTAVRVDANNREVKPNGEPLVPVVKQTATGLAETKKVETAAKNTTKVEQHGKQTPPQQHGQNFRRQPQQAK